MLDAREGTVGLRATLRGRRGVVVRQARRKWEGKRTYGDKRRGRRQRHIRVCILVLFSCTCKGLRAIKRGRRTGALLTSPSSATPAGTLSTAALIVQSPPPQEPTIPPHLPPRRGTSACSPSHPPPPSPPSILQQQDPTSARWPVDLLQSSAAMHDRSNTPPPPPPAPPGCLLAAE
eukprot:765375-Hanusia_phi.AAC.2